MKAVFEDFTWNPFKLLRRRSVSQGAPGGYDPLPAGEHQRGINGSTAANGPNAQFKKKWRSSISTLTPPAMASSPEYGSVSRVRQYYYRFCSGPTRIFASVIIAFLIIGGIVGFIRKGSDERGGFFGPPEPRIPSMDWEKAASPRYPWMEYPKYVQRVRHLHSWVQVQETDFE